MSRSFVYVITHVPTTRHYVGKTKVPKARWSQHKRAVKDSLIARALKRYPRAEFTFTLVEEHPDEQAAYDAEAWWVAFLRSNVRGFGFNLESGGNVAKTVADSTREKCRLTNLGRQRSPAFRAKVAAARSGSSATDETRAKMSARRKGVPKSPEHREKIRAAHIGKVRSPEHCAALSAAKLRDYETTCRNLREAAKKRTGPPPMLGRKHTPEARRKISEARRRSAQRKTSST